ncbi:MAG: ACP S-malonyltransferase [Candidatus Eisenbacteria bacterium]
MRVGLLFPGQGSQFVGMGKELFDAFPAARATYEEADSILGFSISGISFEGPEDTLRQTLNTQPAIFVHSIAAFRVLREEGLSPAAGMGPSAAAARASQGEGDRGATSSVGRLSPELAAGHSLGEYSALVAAGAVDFKEALLVVRKRGELMHEAGLERPGTMAAILGLSPDEVEGICREASAAGLVQPANINSSSQLVISGEVKGVEEAVRLAWERGAKKAVKLPVSGAFHSPLMASAAKGLSEVLSGVALRRASFAVVANYSAAPVSEPEEIRANLAKQVLGAVRWQESMNVMLSSGLTHFLEIGPGSVLKGLMRGIDRGVGVHPVGTPGDVSGVAELVKSTSV